MKPIDYDLLGNPIYRPLDLAIAARPVPIPGVNASVDWTSRVIAARMPDTLKDAMETLMKRGKK